MQIQEVFEVEAAPAAVWPFFGQVERVARCVPGVKDDHRRRDCRLVSAAVP